LLKKDSEPAVASAAGIPPRQKPTKREIPYRIAAQNDDAKEFFNKLLVRLSQETAAAVEALKVTIASRSKKRGRKIGQYVAILANTATSGPAISRHPATPERALGNKNASESLIWTSGSRIIQFSNPRLNDFAARAGGNENHEALASNFR
jgi:hypothetical protein